MLDSIYIGMSGLISFSKGLNNISNNVANMNTPGFKGSQLEFLDLFYRHQYSGSNPQYGSPYSKGSGVKTGATITNFSSGEFRQTGGDLDVAINGNGFFILRQDGKLMYTRAGQFKIDDAGYLVTRDDGTRVAGLINGSLVDISLAGKLSSPAIATKKIDFVDTLSTTSSTFEVKDIAVYDSLGNLHSLTLSLANDTATIPGQWSFYLVEDTTILSSGNLMFAGDGSILPGYEKHVFTFNPGNGATSQEVTLDFSEAKFLSSSASNLRVGTSDGRPAGSLINTAINTEGWLTLSYSNGESIKDCQLALAWFNNLSALKPEGLNRYTVFGETQKIIAGAGEKGMGNFQSRGIELSNVDLAQEFSELIIVQRGYQASSQVLTAANEMIQQLGEIRGRR